MTSLLDKPIREIFQERKRADGLVWYKESKMQAELQKEAKTRDRDKYGNDGHMLAATGEFKYKGIKYTINVMRYYILNSHGRPTGFTTMSRDRDSEYFANLEYPESTKDVVEVVKLIREYSSAFLYNDSLHSYCDNMTIAEQIDAMHKIAHEDIDSLSTLTAEIDTKIKALENIKLKVKIVGGTK